MRTRDREDVPEEFLCPITGLLMQDPVVMKDGYSFERTAIASWIARQSISPITRERISMDEAIPNRALKAAIDRYASKLFPITIQWRSPRGIVNSEIAICLNHTIRDLKERIEQSLKIPVNCQTLAFENGVLGDDGATVFECSICEGDCVEVRCPYVQVQVRPPIGKEIKVHLLPYKTVRELKEKVEAVLGLSVEEQRFVSNGKELGDDVSFGELRIPSRFAEGEIDLKACTEPGITRGPTIYVFKRRRGTQGD
jgi:hypothetical protein